MYVALNDIKVFLNNKSHFFIMFLPHNNIVFSKHLVSLYNFFFNFTRVVKKIICRKNNMSINNNVTTQ